MMLKRPTSKEIYKHLSYYRTVIQTNSPFWHLQKSYIISSLKKFFNLSSQSRNDRMSLNSRRRKILAHFTSEDITLIKSEEKMRRVRGLPEGRHPSKHSRRSYRGMGWGRVHSGMYWMSRRGRPIQRPVPTVVRPPWSNRGVLTL